jgi:hypothetical protein
MQLILRGRRAARYAGIGKRRIAFLRANKQKYGKSAVRVPAGFVIAQTVDKIDRVIVDVNDPYLIIQSTRVVNGTSSRLLVNLEGGVTDEPFENNGINAVVDVGFPQYINHMATYVACGNSVFTSFTADEQEFVAPAILTKLDLITGKASFIYGNTLFNELNSPGPMGFYVESGLTVVVAGHVGEGRENNLFAVYQWVIWVEDPAAINGYRQVQPFIAAVNVSTDDLDLSGGARVIWPPADANDGNFRRLPPAACVISAGKNKVAWTQRYDQKFDTDIFSGDIERLDFPRLVVYDLESDTYTEKEIRSFFPEVPLENTENNDNDSNLARAYATSASLGYCGNGVLIAWIPNPDANGDPLGNNYLARSTDYGATWSLLGYRPSVGWVPYQFEAYLGNLRPAYSFAPGKMWIYLINSQIFPLSADWRLLYTEDYGNSWTEIDIPINRKYPDGHWDITENSLPACYGAITPVYDKFRKGYVYCATRYSTDGEKLYMDVYDSFSPTAQRLSTQRVPANYNLNSNAPYYATFFGTTMPLLPGHPGELGDINEPEES